MPSNGADFQIGPPMDLTRTFDRSSGQYLLDIDTHKSLSICQYRSKTECYDAALSNVLLTINRSCTCVFDWRASFFPGLLMAMCNIERIEMI